jgi:hypothetical protein
METKDYEDMFGALARRINGGGNAEMKTLLDRLKDEFKNHKILTIQNFDKLNGAIMDVGNGNRWGVDYVEETNTTYFFGLSKRNDGYFTNEVRIGLNRVPIAGRDVEMYNLYNESFGGWVAVSKEVLKDKDTLMQRMIELTELPF